MKFEYVFSSRKWIKFPKCVISMHFMSCNHDGCVENNQNVADNNSVIHIWYATKICNCIHSKFVLLSHECWMSFNECWILKSFNDYFELNINGIAHTMWIVSVKNTWKIKSSRYFPIRNMFSIFQHALPRNLIYCPILFPYSNRRASQHKHLWTLW